jgi:5-methylcytosine-specific restriction endonuclease McrA
MQQTENPEISGAEYQQGQLQGYEVREYLLEKWGRKCAYCGAEYTPLQVEHIQPKARGGSNRISNLTLACQPCNQRKGAMPVEQFLALLFGCCRWRSGSLPPSCGISTIAVDS